MPSQTDTHSYLSELISVARQKKGWTTLKELYRETKPAVDYQSWLHAESGRRIPHPKNLLEMGSILGIAKEDLLIAYCKDKFNDVECHEIVDSFLFKKFINVETLLEANQHNKVAHTFTSEQIAAMKLDLRIRLYLSYTYDENLKTTISRLAQFFNVEFAEANVVVQKLQALSLVSVEGENITRYHRYLDMPTNSEVFALRRDLLISGLAQNIKPTSHISNFHVMLSEDSLKKVMAFICFAEANFLKLTKQDFLASEKKGSRIQIAIAVNMIEENIPCASCA